MRREFLLAVAVCGLLVISALARAEQGPLLAVNEQSDFAQISAATPLQDGSFVMAGVLQREGDVTRSGLLHVSAAGKALAPIIELKSPNEAYPGVAAMDIVAMPGGDLLVGGWLVSKDAKFALWVARVTVGGSVVWSQVVADEFERKVYRLKLLANGQLLAVGRTQVGASDQPARGLAIWFNTGDGSVPDEGKKFIVPNCPGDVLRCAFQDAAELSDGSLVFAGWITRNKKDDIWVLKTDANGQAVKSEVYGESGNDVAFAVAAQGDTVLVAGTKRKGKSDRIVALDTFDQALGKRRTIAFSQSGDGQARVLLALPQKFLIGGEIETDSETNGFVAALPSDGKTAEVTGTTADGGADRFLGIAMNGKGDVVLTGFAGPVGKRKGVFSLYAEEGGLCAPGDTVAALALDGGKQSGCAVSGTPARFKLSGAKADGAIVVRASQGDVDAVLVRDGAIVASSLNGKGLPELLTLPEDQDNLELSVSASTPTAVFTVEVPAIQPAPEPAGEGEEGGETAEAPSLEDARLSDFALQTLGYEIGGEPIELAGSVKSFDSQAILAFQAAEGYPLTGVLTKDERNDLFRLTARRIDLMGQAAAAAARLATKSSAPVDADYNQFDTVTGVVVSTGTYGVGHLKKDGGEFSGRFQGRLTDPSTKPVLGVWTINDTCSFTFGVADGFEPSYSVSQPGFGTFGVIRTNGQIYYAGHMGGLAPLSGCQGSG